MSKHLKFRRLPEISKDFKTYVRSKSSDFLFYIINTFGVKSIITQILRPIFVGKFYSLISFLSIEHKWNNVVLCVGSLCQSVSVCVILCQSVSV
jgi:hypothetical protein